MIVTFTKSNRKVIERYRIDISHFARVFRVCAFQDGILVENMHDIPYIKRKDLSPEIVTMMTRICTEVRKVVPRNMACGVQV